MEKVVTALKVVEAICQRTACEEVTYSDEFYINKQGVVFEFSNDYCDACGHGILGEWKLSDQPHPELFV